MVDTLFIVPLQIFLYGLSYMVLTTTWGIVRSLLSGGFMVQAITSWLQTDLFGPAITEVQLVSDGILPMFATIAVWLLAFSYLLSPFFKIRVVDWKKALVWFLGATILFQYGPSLYIEVEELRREFASNFYTVVFDQVRATGGVPQLLAIEDGPDDVPLEALSNQFEDTIEGDDYVDGLDIAMSYTLSGALDVLEAPNPLPTSFAEAFAPEQDDPTWLSYTPDERLDFIASSWLGTFRLMLAVPIVIFGIVEQLIYLCLTVAAGILFIDLALALPFALFERTELMARSVLDMMLELFIFSAIVAALQAILIGVVTSAANTLRPTLAFSATFIGLMFEIGLLTRAAGAILDASKRMFQAMSQVVGGQVMSPSEAAMAGATAAGAAAVGVATAGVGAIGAYAATGSVMSAAGSALAGSDKLFNTAALGQMALPEGSQLKEKLSGFYEGALAQRMAPGLGGLLLREDGKAPRSHGQAEASAEGMREAARQQAAAERLPAGGQQDIRFDAADVLQLREALATALAQAIRSTPQGGYRSADDALAAISRALSGLGRDPRTDPAMGAFLAPRGQGAADYVMTGYLTLTEQSQSAPTSQSGSGGGESSPPSGSSPAGRGPSLPSLGSPPSSGKRTT